MYFLVLKLVIPNSSYKLSKLTAIDNIAMIQDTYTAFCGLERLLLTSSNFCLFLAVSINLAPNLDN